MKIDIIKNTRGTTKYTIENSLGGGCDLNEFSSLLYHISNYLDAKPDEMAEADCHGVLDDTEEGVVDWIIGMHNRIASYDTTITKFCDEVGWERKSHAD